MFEARLVPNLLYGFSWRETILPARFTFAVLSFTAVKNVCTMTLLGAAESRDRRSTNHSRAGAGGGATGAAFAQTGQQTKVTGDEQTKASTLSRRR